MAVIGDALGHADEQTAKKLYAHLGPDQVQKAIDAHLPRLDLEQNNVTAIKR